MARERVMKLVVLTGRCWEVKIEEETRKAKYVQRNTEALSYIRCCRGKAMSVTQPEFVYLWP